MRTIKEGDKVTVVWSSEKTLVGTIKHMPSNTGDLMYVTTESGTEYAINTNSSSFDCIYKI